MIEIRVAQFEDIEELREVAISSFQDAFAALNSPENLEAYYHQFYTIDNLMKEQTEINARVFLAIEDNRIVGFVRIRETNEASDKLGSNILELHRLYVLTSAQGKAVGKNLMNKAIEYARDKKYEWIWLGVWEKNLKAQKFYAGFGFEKFSEHTFWQGAEPQLDWMLKKKL